MEVNLCNQVAEKMVKFLSRSMYLSKVDKSELKDALNKALLETKTILIPKAAFDFSPESRTKKNRKLQLVARKSDIPLR